MDNKIVAHPAAVSIGRRLKDAREKKSLTIEQVQKQSRIHSSVLRALEEGSASQLLTETYVRSFLKKYAQMLDLPANDVLKEYFPPHSEPLTQGQQFDNNPLPYETKVGPKFLYFTGIAVFGIAALLVTVLLAGKMISSVNKARMSQREKRVANAVVAKKRQPKAAKPQQQQKKKVAAKTGANQDYIIPRSSQLNLTFRVKQPVLVTLKKDGVLMYNVPMKKDTVETITANESIELDFIRAEALEITLNGHQIPLPSKSNIHGVIITRKGVKFK